MNKKIAIVTGATKGIGKAIALALKDNFFVIGTATSDSGASSISEYLGKDGLGAVLQQNDKSSVENFIKIVRAIATPVSVLVNNAGITKDTLFLRMSEDDWNQVIDTNLNGVFRLTKEFITDMSKERWGRIVNISSVVASSSNAGQANYISSKAAIEGLTKALAIEFASRNITVNAVAPGFIETDMTNKLTEVQKERVLQNIPMKRMGSPEDIANAVKFLVDEYSSYITGAVLHINGGLYIK